MTQTSNTMRIRCATRVHQGFLRSGSGEARRSSPRRRTGRPQGSRGRFRTVVRLAGRSDEVVKNKFVMTLSSRQRRQDKLLNMYSQHVSRHVRQSNARCFFSQHIFVKTNRARHTHRGRSPQSYSESNSLHQLMRHVLETL